MDGDRDVNMDHLIGPSNLVVGHIFVLNKCSNHPLIGFHVVYPKTYKTRRRWEAQGSITGRVPARNALRLTGGPCRAALPNMGAHRGLGEAAASVAFELFTSALLPLTLRVAESPPRVVPRILRFTRG